MISLLRAGEFLNRTEGLLGTSSGSVGGVVAYGSGAMNEPLRRALLRARMREDDVAARLGVDPKTVRRWLDGRTPYSSNRLALADLVGADEADLWPGAGGPLSVGPRPEELGAVYPHRWAIPRAIWARFFESADQEIWILAYSALFLAEDTGIVATLAEKGRGGVPVRIALGNPQGLPVARRGDEEGIGTAMPAKIRNALALFRPLAAVSNVKIRLHDAVLYNSIYRADEDLLVNQHVFGTPAAHAPVFCVRIADGADMAATYVDSFDQVWAAATPLDGRD